MTALAKDKVWLLGDQSHQIDFPVKTATTIYKGSFLCLESADGYARPCAASLTGEEFLGVAMTAVTSNAAASGTEEVRILQKFSVETTITGASAVTDIGELCYMSDDNVFTTASTNNVLVGTIRHFNADNSKFLVNCEAEALRSNA